MLDEKPTTDQQLDSLMAITRAAEGVKLSLKAALEAESHAKIRYEQAVAAREGYEKDLAEKRERIRALAKQV
jgi:hypothetical protein